MKFTEYLMEDRIRILSQERNIEVIYDLFEKHLNQPASELRSKYKLEADFYMNRVTIRGEMSDIYDLHNYLNRLQVPMESVTPTSIRIDIYILINRVR